MIFYNSKFATNHKKQFFVSFTTCTFVKLEEATYILTAKHLLHYPKNFQKI